MASVKQEKNGGKVTTTYEFQFPQKKEKISCGQFFYDSRDGTIMGRTGTGWGQLFLFYAIFYAVLVALFAICMQGLFSTLNNDKPKWTLERSLIGTNPGLGFRPLAEDIEQGSIIRYDSTKPEEINYWVQRLEEFLKPYENSNERKPCNFSTPAGKDAVCEVDISNFGDCSKANSFGYLNHSPCVFLKLNRIYDWKPEFYSNETDFPQDMPPELKQYISNQPLHKREQIWISCAGKYPHDQEKINNVKYFPTRGFPSFYYPFRNQPNYLSPLIAVQFVHPPMGQLINIECKAWAKNIEIDASQKDRKGSVLFEVMID